MLKTLALSALLSVGSATAPAACTMANLAGGWTACNIAELPDHSLAWVTCVLTIGRTGAFSTKTSLCVNSNGAKIAPEGQFKVSAAYACAFTASIKFPATGTGGTVESLTLSMDKKSAAGIGTGSSGVFMITMVKVK